MEDERDTPALQWTSTTPSCRMTKKNKNFFFRHLSTALKSKKINTKRLTVCVDKPVWNDWILQHMLSTTAFMRTSGILGCYPPVVCSQFLKKCDKIKILSCWQDITDWGEKKALTVFVIHGNLLLLSMWDKFIRNKSVSIFRFASQNLRLRLIFMLK